MNEDLALALYTAGAIQFGEFKLKSGIVSPFYLDLRLLVSYPRVLRDAARAMATTLAGCTFDRLAAIPYAGLPIGVALALEMNRPLIYPRREIKDHGTGRMIEGEFRSGETVVLVDDVITKGTSKVEALQPLLGAGLSVRDMVVLIDREQGGVEELAARGFRIHSVLKARQIMSTLKDADKISEGQYQSVLSFLARD